MVKWQHGRTQVFLSAAAGRTEASSGSCPVIITFLLFTSWCSVIAFLKLLWGHAGGFLVCRTATVGSSQRLPECFVLRSGSLWGRVEEQSLWSGRHLGEQSPASLLRSLVYLNTKYFGLRTVEQHLRLSFANVYGPDTIHPVSKEHSVCIRVPSIPQDHHGNAATYVSFLSISYGSGWFGFFF